MAEEKSKILELYNTKSGPFSGIGRKMDSLVGKQIPSTGNSGKATTTDILGSFDSPNLQNFTPEQLVELQKDFMEIIVKPFSTILEVSSNFGKIFVKPYQSLMNLINKMNMPATKVVLNSDMKILQYSSPFSRIITPSGKSLISLTPPSSGQSSTVNFIPNDLNTGFTANAKFGITEFVDAKVPGINIMKPSPEKTTIGTVEMKKIEMKPFSKLGVMSDIPRRSLATLQEMSSIPNKDEQSQELSIIGQTPEKVAGNTGITKLPDFTPKVDQIIETQIPNRINLAESSTDKIGIVNYIPDMYQYGFKINSQLGISDYRINNIFSTSIGIKSSQLSATHFFNGFITNALNSNSIYNNTSIPTYNVIIGENTPEAFDFRKRVGVFYQYDVFTKNQESIFGEPAPLSFSSLLSRITRKWTTSITPGQLNVYTPRFTMSDALNNQPGEYRTYPPNQNTGQYTDDSVLSGRNLTFGDRLMALGMGMVGSILDSAALSLLQKYTDIDLSPLQVTKLGIGMIAGNVYYSTEKFEPRLSRYKKAGGTDSMDNMSSTMGVLKGVAQAATSVAGALGMNVIPPGLAGEAAEAMLMMSHVLAGTKYTKSYAFYDRTTRTYSSYYDKIGNNAVNLYSDDGSSQILSKASDSNAKYGGLRDNIDTNFALSIYQRYKKGLSQSPATTKPSADGGWNVVPKTITDKFDRLLGQGAAALQNPVLLLADSFTFGTYSQFNIQLPNRVGKKYQYWYSHYLPSGVYSYAPDLNADGAMSIDINHDEDNKLIIKSDDWKKASQEKNFSAEIAKRLNNKDLPKTFKNSFKNTIEEIDGDGKIETIYSAKLKEKLSGKTVTLIDRGFPDLQRDSGYKDFKNLLELQKSTKDNKFTDTDLIDFYFEDVTSETASTTIMAFRAILTSYNDSTTADWQTQTYVGRPDKFYIYGGFDRKVTVGFDVHINSSDELMPTWRKLNYLQGMCYPTSYPQAVPMVSPIMRITIGTLLHRIYVVMNSINFSFDESTIWETTPGFQLPLNIKVSVDFNVLYDSLPINTSQHFAQEQDWINPAKIDYKQQNNSDSEMSGNTQKTENTPQKYNNTDGVVEYQGNNSSLPRTQLRNSPPAE